MIYAGMWILASVTAFALYLAVYHCRLNLPESRLTRWVSSFGWAVSIAWVFKHSGLSDWLNTCLDVTALTGLSASFFALWAVSMGLFFGFDVELERQQHSSRIDARRSDAGQVLNPSFDEGE